MANIKGREDFSSGREIPLNIPPILAFINSPHTINKALAGLDMPAYTPYICFYDA